MEYLRRQQQRAETALERGVALEDAFATKFYIQTLLSESVMALVSRGARILEVGCGGSLAIHFLARQGYRCIAADNSLSSLGFAGLLRRYLHSAVGLLDADAFRLPFRDRAFDYVYSVGMIEHYPRERQQQLVREMRRCTRKFVHLEIPNLSPDSAFQPVLRTTEEVHLPCDLHDLLAGAGLTSVVDDGRCLFPRPELVRANDALRRFVEGVEGYEQKESYGRDDIESLCRLERSVAPEARRRFGYQVFAIGECR